jgi:hypothetical protein
VWLSTGHKANGATGWLWRRSPFRGVKEFRGIG